jgi:hypothetical protein
MDSLSNHLYCGIFVKGWEDWSETAGWERA